MSAFRSGALLFGSLLGLSLPLLAPAAHAQSASEIAAAKQWFKEGLALEDKGQFGEALERFRRALSVKKTPQIQFHVGLCELKTGALVEAIVSLERAAELAKSENNKQVEGAANGELASLRPRVPMLEITVKGGAKPTAVSLDGVPLALAALDAAIPVNPGRHELTAEFPTGTAKRSVNLAERERAKLELEPPSADVEVPAVAPTPATPAPKPTEGPKPPTPFAPPGPPPAPAGTAQNARPTSMLPWVLVGGGVVAVAGGFYAWKLRSDKIDELDAICPSRTSCPSSRASDVDSLESKGKTYNALAFGLWGVGAAALVSGGVLLLDSGAKERAPTARVAPIVAPGFAGASYAARF